MLHNIWSQIAENHQEQSNEELKILRMGNLLPTILLSSSFLVRTLVREKFTNSKDFKSGILKL